MASLKRDRSPTNKEDEKYDVEPSAKRGRTAGGERASRTSVVLPHADSKCAAWISHPVMLALIAARRARVRETLLSLNGVRGIQVTADLTAFVSDAPHADWERLVRAALVACDREHMDGRLSAFLHEAALELSVWDEHVPVAMAQEASSIMPADGDVSSLYVHLSKAALLAAKPPLVVDGVECADRLALFLHACERKLADVCARFLCWRADWAPRLARARFNHHTHGGGEGGARVQYALDEAPCTTMAVRMGGSHVSNLVVFDDVRTRLTYATRLEDLLGNEGMNPYTGAPVPLDSAHGLTRATRQQVRLAQQEYAQQRQAGEQLVVATRTAADARFMSDEWFFGPGSETPWTLEGAKTEAKNEWGVSRETIAWLSRWMYGTYASLHAAYILPASVCREVASFGGGLASKHVYRGVGAHLFNVSDTRRFWPASLLQAVDETTTREEFRALVDAGTTVHLLSKPTSASHAQAIGRGFASSNMGAFTSSIFGLVFEIEINDAKSDMLVDARSLPTLVQQAIAGCTNTSQLEREQEVILLPGAYNTRIIELTGAIGKSALPWRYLANLTRLSDWFRGISRFEKEQHTWVVRGTMRYSRMADTTLTFRSIANTNRSLSIDTATLTRLELIHPLPAAHQLAVNQQGASASSQGTTSVGVQFSNAPALLTFCQEHAPILFQ